MSNQDETIFGVSESTFANLVFNFKTNLSRCKAQGVCPSCNGTVCAGDFRDDLSLRESQISGLCQSCQDVAFAEDDEENV